MPGPVFKTGGANDVKDKPNRTLRKSDSQLSVQGQREEPFGPDLAEAMDAWESLDEAVKTTIMMLVRSVTKAACK